MHTAFVAGYAGWGVEPAHLYVPSPRIWDLVVPAWLSGRRAEVMDRLVAHSGHLVLDDGVGHEWFDARTRGPSPFRLVTR
jgi:hypothetical protein